MSIHNLIEEIIENPDELNDWEAGFIQDMNDKSPDYVFSDKQTKKIESIYKEKILKSKK